LFAAALGGGELIRKLLLEWGANVMLADDNGWTALQSAPQNGYEPTVQLLLEVGANVRAAQCEWLHGLSTARRAGHDSIVQPLLDKGADVSRYGSRRRYSIIHSGV
jgi:ankyrin repeat protein